MAQVYGKVAASVSNSGLNADAVNAGVKGEITTAKIIEEALADYDNIRIFHSVRVPGTTYDADHVILMGNLMVVVDAKNWKSNSHYVFEPVTSHQYAGKILDEKIIAYRLIDGEYDTFPGSEIHIPHIAASLMTELETRGTRHVPFTTILNIASSNITVGDSHSEPKRFKVTTNETLADLLKAYANRNSKRRPNWKMTRILKRWVETGKDVPLATYLPYKQHEELYGWPKPLTTELWNLRVDQNRTSKRLIASFRIGFWVMLLPIIVNLWFGAQASLLLSIVGLIHGWFASTTYHSWRSRPYTIFLFLLVIVLTLLSATKVLGFW